MRKVASLKSDGASKRSKRAWEEEFEGMPDTVTRKCTDTRFLVIFVLAYALWLLAMAHSMRVGNLDRLRAFEDGNGMRCEPAGPTPRLFFCRNNSGHLDLHRPICRSQCPNSTETSAPECGEAADYPTEQLLGMVCLPIDRLDDRHERHSMMAFAESAKSTVASRICVERWRSLAACVIITVCASYIMIYILENNANCLVRFGLVTLSGGCFLSGCYLFSLFESLSLVPAPSPYNTAGAVFLTVFGLLFFCVLASMRDSVEAACDCIELACKCVMQTPILTMQPLIATLTHLVSSIVSMLGILMILSNGHEHLLGEVVGFSLGWLDATCFWFFLLMWLWIHQVIFALGEFVIAYAGALWYFAGAGQGPMPRPLPRCTLLQSYWYAHRYHFGTLVKGGLVVGWSRVLRIPLGLLVSWTGMNTPIGKVFGYLCCGLKGMYDSIHPFSKNAFIDVAMNARPFHEAAHCAEYVVQRESDTIRILNGATWLFQLAGICANAGLGACAMLFYSNMVVGDDPAVTLVMCLAGAATSAMAALPFAMIFDTVSDTILYCSEIEEIREQRMLPKRVKGGVVARLCPCVYRSQQTAQAGKQEALMWQSFMSAGAPAAAEDPLWGTVRADKAASPFSAGVSHDEEDPLLSRPAGPPSDTQRRPPAAAPSRGRADAAPPGSTGGKGRGGKGSLR